MTYEVHPVAALFPMLADDELDELAADIRERGLLHPVVLDTDGRVLDGRNRLAACGRAGIEPAFTTYDGEDPAGYALAVNVSRRNLRPSQRYIIIEEARRLTQIPKSESAVHSPRLSEAAIVLDWAPDLAVEVKAGVLALDKAAAVAREKKRTEKDIEAKKKRLRAGAVDLADHVAEGRLDLDEALAALDAREAKARAEAEAARQEAAARASERERQRQVREQERRESLERDRDRLRSVITGWPTMRNTILPDPDGTQATEIRGGLGESDQLALKQIIAELTERPQP